MPPAPPLPLLLPLPLPLIAPFRLARPCSCCMLRAVPSLRPRGPLPLGTLLPCFLRALGGRACMCTVPAVTPLTVGVE